MSPQDWEEAEIATAVYANPHATHGFRRVDGLSGNILNPAEPEADRAFDRQLARTFRHAQKAYPDITLCRYHVRMPYWRQTDKDLPTTYPLVPTPERLITTSVTVALVPRQRIRCAEMGYYMNGRTLKPLRERLAGSRHHGIAGNLGYRMTENLIHGRLPWSHHLRYPDFPLAPVLSYLGFHLFRDRDSGQVNSAFQGAHPSAVGIQMDGQVKILPRLEIPGYQVTLWNQTFTVRAINVTGRTANESDVALYTPGLWMPETVEHIDNWQTYAPEVPGEARVNVFIANEGDGSQPIEKVIHVWDGRAPLPSFGAVLSFSRERFAQLFASKRLPLNEPVAIRPIDCPRLECYRQILGGFVPAVVDGHHLFCVESIEQVRRHLHEYGNALSPLAECGRESRNFDPVLREPAGLFVQTTDGSVGWVLFDGRHEFSIGANVVDVGQILKLLQERGICEIEQAFFVDGGSAMKVYAVETGSLGEEGGDEEDNEDLIKLDLLNRVAAGSRNRPGADPDGLNLYTLLMLDLID
jgi:hypothetical protein